jgi:hypothetical protein
MEAVMQNQNNCTNVLQDLQAVKFIPDVGYFIDDPKDVITGWANCLYRKGTYSKIDGLVLFNIDIKLYSFEEWQTTYWRKICITNLPFIPCDNTAYSIASYRLYSAKNAPGFLPTCLINTGENNIVVGFTDFKNFDFRNMLVDWNLKNDTEFHLSGHYFTDE